jgi:hypothetical protein
VTSILLLFLPTKIKNTEFHLMVDSSTTNNFINHNLVPRLNLPTNWLKPPIHISFTNGCAQSIQHYCLVQVPLDPRYKPLVKFYITDIVYDAYLGQLWLVSANGIVINWTTSNIHLKSNITIQGIWKREKQLNLISAFQFEKAMKNDQVFLGIICSKEPEDKLLPLSLKVQELLNKYADIFPNELLKNLPPE